MDVPAIILAGGLGTRLQGVIKDLPKPMAPVNGKPFLHYVFSYLKTQTISNAVLAVGYKHESIQSYFGSSYLGINIQYAVEEEPLGTGGGILQAFAQVNDCAFVLNGDTLFDISLEKLKSFYSASGADIALALKHLEKFERYGTVYTDSGGRVTSFAEKKPVKQGLINGGVYFFSKKIFDRMEAKGKFSFETEILEKGVERLNIMGVVYEDYFIDIGVPEDYQKAQHDFK